jgi:hypothetical protein
MCSKLFWRAYASLESECNAQNYIILQTLHTTSHNLLWSTKTGLQCSFCFFWVKHQIILVYHNPYYSDWTRNNLWITVFSYFIHTAAFSNEVILVLLYFLGNSWSEVKRTTGNRTRWRRFVDALCPLRDNRNWWWWWCTCLLMYQSVANLWGGVCWAAAPPSKSKSGKQVL